MKEATASKVNADSLEGSEDPMQDAIYAITAAVRTLTGGACGQGRKVRARGGGRAAGFPARAPPSILQQPLCHAKVTQGLNSIRLGKRCCVLDNVSPTLMQNEAKIHTRPTVLSP